MKKFKILLLVSLTVTIFIGFTKPADAFYFAARKFFKTMNTFVDEFTDEEGQHSSRLFETATSSLVGSAIPQLCSEVGCVDQETHDRMEAENLAGLSTAVDNQVMAMFNNHPDIDVIAHLADEWVPGHRESKTVYASGFADLQESGIQPLWNFMRNLAYLGFVIIMIVIGFMIMFRHKIGGQMIVTVGNTIPRVVVSLVLVTFSFAIMGLILDISGIMMKLTMGILGGVDIHHIWGLLVGTLGIVGTGLGIGGIVLGLIGGFLKPIGFVVLAVAAIVIGFIVWGAIKLWFALVKSYFSLLVNVVTAPVVLMVGALPGNNAAIANLFKSALRNALVFPVAYAIVNIPYFLGEQGGGNINLSFPSTVFGQYTGDFELGGFFLALAKVLAIYVAAQTPQFMKAIIPATASKSGADVAGAIQGGLSKVPLLGGFFGK
jgi:hypothetical protein